jgi:hypothetical protein
MKRSIMTQRATSQSTMTLSIMALCIKELSIMITKST